MKETRRNIPTSELDQEESSKGCHHDRGGCKKIATPPNLVLAVVSCFLGRYIKYEPTALSVIMLMSAWPKNSSITN